MQHNHFLVKTRTIQSHIQQNRQGNTPLLFLFKKGEVILATGLVESKKEVIVIRKEIPSGFTDVISERIKADCTIEEIRIRFYRGQQLSLKVYPFVEHKGHKIESFFTFPSTTDNTLAGDDDYFVFPVSVPCEYDDYIKIHCHNIDGSYDYTLAVDIVVDYLGGKQRVVQG